MKARLLLLLGAGFLAFAAFAVASLPARVVFDLVGASAGVRAGLVQGSVWDSAAWRLQLGEASLAEARAQLAPASLLSGSARFDVQLFDPTLRGDGQIVLRPSGSSIEAAQGVIGLERLPLGAFLPAGEVATVRINTVSFDSEGRCEEADGTVQSAALVSVGESLGVALPSLQGALFCAGDQLALALEGRNDQLDLEGSVRFDASAAQWSVTARTQSREVTQALSLIGFRQDGPGLFVLDSNALSAEG